MTRDAKYTPEYKAQVLDTLRREIHAARLKVILDKELGRSTSQEVKRLAEMKPPSSQKPFFPMQHSHAARGNAAAGYVQTKK